MSTTLEDVIIDLLFAGADRGALVRDEGGVGVCVLLLSPVAVQRLGSPLIEIVTRLGSSDAMPPTVNLDTSLMDTSLMEAFAICERSPARWVGFRAPFRKIEVIGVLFVGEVCAEVAAICTAHGAPCSLDPAKAAKGYEIVERRTPIAPACACGNQSAYWAGPRDGQRVYGCRTCHNEAGR